MHPHQQILKLMQSGSRPQITFTKAVEDLEGYPEAGMKAQVIEATEIDNEMIRIVVDYTPFDAQNQALEKANYYDKGGKPTLTARQAGMYQPTESFLIDFSDKYAATFSIDSSERISLFERYQAQMRGAKEQASYVTWLEDQVLKGTVSN
jgi:hypothetical protein